MKKSKQLMGLFLATTLASSVIAPMNISAATYDGAYLINESFPESQFYSPGDYKTQTNNVLISGNVTWKAYKAAGLSGKADDDFAAYGTADTEGQRKLANYQVTSSADVITGEVSYWAEEMGTDDLSVMFGTGWNAATVIVNLNKDGSITTGDGTNAVHATFENAIEANRWYKIAISANKTENKTKVYVNGEWIDTLDFAPESISRFEPNHITRSVTTKYKFAFDDFKLYEADYDNTTDLVTYPESVVDNAITLVDSVDATEIEGATAVITPDGEKISGMVSDGSLAVFTSESGETFKYVPITVENYVEPEPTDTPEPTEDPNVPETEISATTSELGITSSVKRVVVRDDKIAALSTPWHASWCVSSSVLVSGLTSSQGYSLAYVDDNKQPAEVSNVTGGYIKASKDGNVAYIPVVTRLDEYEFDVLDGGIYGTDVAFKAEDKGLGGKAEDDEMYVIKAKYLPSSTSEWPAKEIKLTDILNGVDATLPFTVVFNAYVDDEAVMRLNVGGRVGNSNAETETSVTVMTMNAQSGKVRYDKVNVGWGDYTGSYEGGKWHRIALTWDPRTGDMSSNNGSSGSLFMSIDGKERVQTLFMQSINVTSLVIGLDRAGGNGRLAFDDFKAYYGWYDADLDGTVLSSADVEGISINSLLGTAIVDPEYYNDLDCVVQALKDATGESNIVVFENDEYLDKATTLASGNVAVIKTEEGTYHYLTLSVEAKDEYNTAYIREDFSNVTVNDVNNSKIKTQLYTDDGCYTISSTSDVGGKSDKAMMITSVAGKQLKSTADNTPQIDLADNSGVATNIVTAECMMASMQDDPSKANEGNVEVALIQDMDWGKSLKVALHRDGNVYVNDLATGITYLHNVWYKVAFTVNHDEKTAKIYLNGELISEITDFEYEKAATRYRASISFDTTDGVSKFGQAAFDDYRIYSVEYDPTDDKIDVAFGSDVDFIESENKIVSKDLTRKQILDSIKTNAEFVDVYEDDWLDTALEDDDVAEEGCIVMLVSKSGECYRYLTFGDAPDTEIGEITVSKDEENNISASIDVVSMRENAMLILARKDAEGRLVGISIRNITKEDAGANVATKLAYDENSEYSAYIWSDDMDALGNTVKYVK